MKRRLLVTIAGAGAVAIAMCFAVFSDRGARTAQKPGRSSVAPLAPGGGLAEVTAGRQAADPTISSGEKVTPVSLDVDLRDLPRGTPTLRARPEPSEAVGPHFTKQLGQGEPAPAVPSVPNVMPAATTFAGMNLVANGAGFPPDTVGDVGPGHYIQAVNTSFAIYNKASGAALAGPLTFDAFFTGTGTPCDASNDGDPTVVYDPLANRFIIADFAWGPTETDFENGPYYECVAVSKTSDPVAGGWWLYAIRTDDANHPWLADYPKMGIWPDGLYMTANMFDVIDCGVNCSSFAYEEVRVWAFDRVDLEAGVAVDTRIADLNSPNYFSLVPSHMTGASPPAGRDNLLVSESQTDFKWEVWAFNVDYVGGGSTFTGPTNVTQAAYSCCTFPDIPTPGGNQFDSLADRIMMQNQYKNIASNPQPESLWVTHTVPATSAGPEVTQWAQINVSGGTINTTPVQTQIYNPADGQNQNRWMSSLAVDKAGNMAIGYSVANSTTNPQIRYSGRLAGDTVNTLGQGEATMFAGGGTQTDCSSAPGLQPCSRWGDYSAMTIDPSDGCTFWYTTEYYAADGRDWQTRIGHFAYPSQNCNPPTAVRVARFTATRTKRGVMVAWRSGAKAEVLGFNLYRSQTMKSWAKVNRSVIPARAGTGAVYRLLDRTAKRGQGYNYRLQLVDLKGQRSWHTLGAVSAAR